MVFFKGRFGITNSHGIPIFKLALENPIFLRNSRGIHGEEFSCYSKLNSREILPFNSPHTKSVLLVFTTNSPFL
jgi:hypothetical protein